mmetsp:Transcript_32952/g.33366  ORF Transcript_32952/g.33366 Transcript_32952/m.33366 type:complete len:244 (+) Transcript_32952:680-1411(+)
MDFIEKIIQIPFYLPGVGIDFVDMFIDSQVDAILAQREFASARSLTVETCVSQGIENILARGEPEDKVLQTEYVSFQEEEVMMMKEIFKLLRVSPRCVRRIINVFKVLLLIWKRDSCGRFEADLDLKQATLFLMILVSDASTRAVTYMILNWMELGTMMYHHVAALNDRGENELQDNNLAGLFKKELRNRDKQYELSFNKKEGLHAAKTKHGTLMKSVEKYLTRYEWKSVDEWNEISSKFLLV